MTQKTSESSAHKQIFCADATNPIEVAHSLQGLNYPAGKEDLIKCASENGARQRVLDVINKLSDRELYDTPIKVARAISEIGHYNYFNA
jgi:Protein of unknown function (DUF2795)